MKGSRESVLHRAFSILGAFDPSSESLSLATLSKRSGLPKSSTFRLAHQLVDLGALEITADGRYVIGLRLFEMASLAPRAHGLRAVALPYMEDLHRVTRQHVLLGVREATYGVLVERLSTRDAGEVRHRVGGRIPLVSTGVGRVLLAHAPAVVQQEILDQCIDEWDAPDCRTESDLRTILAGIRLHGFAEVSRIAPEPEPVTSVAAPITNHGKVVAAVSVLAPTREIDTREWRAAVMTVARGISRDLERNTPHSGPHNPLFQRGRTKGAST